MATIPSYPTVIPDNAIDLRPAPPEFEKLVSDTLTDTGTNTDGFDSLFLQVASDLAQFDNLHAGLDFDLLNIGSAAGDLSTPWEQDFSDSLTGTIQQGDGDFKAFNVHLTGNTPPAPAPAPTGGGTPPGPAPTGGGGNGAGGGGGSAGGGGIGGGGTTGGGVEPGTGKE